MIRQPFQPSCRQQSFTRGAVRVALAGWLWVNALVGLAQTPSQPVGVGELVSVLLRKHPYLFNEKALSRLEATYREFRLTEASEREAPRAGAGGRGRPGRVQRPSWPARFALVNLLDTLPGLIRFDSRQGFPGRVPQETIELPGNVGALLFQVVTGREETRYAIRDYSLSGLAHPSRGGPPGHDLGLGEPERCARQQDLAADGALGGLDGNSTTPHRSESPRPCSAKSSGALC